LLYYNLNTRDTRYNMY